MVATIRRRSREESSSTDSTCTPLWLAEMLPAVDLDPCSNPRSHIKADRTYSLEKNLDGLRLPWMGSVFVNWPYSEPMPWAEKTMHELEIGHCTDAIILCKNDNSTEWWKVITGMVTITHRLELWLFNDRIQFDEHPDVVGKRLTDRIQKWLDGDPKKGRLPMQGRRPTSGQSSNNFSSAIIHHYHHSRSSLQLESVATKWRKVLWTSVR